MSIPPPPPIDPRPRWVLLRHDTPDGAWHADLMLERPACPDERRLITFRLGVAPDFALGSRFDAQRLDDHRAAYLDYQGDLSHGRGSVRRLRRGDLIALQHDAGHLEATIRLPDASVRTLRGRPVAAPRWLLVVEHAPGPA